MQYRDYKNFRSLEYYHVFNRGVNKQAIFNEPGDYKQFLRRLGLILLRSNEKGNLNILPFPANTFSLIAYCLMPNHFHILIRQNTDIPVGKLINKLCTSYVSYYNKKYNRVGQLFQDAFKAKHISDDRYMLHLSAYIHLNPKELSFSYPYSSILEYKNSTNENLCDKGFILNNFNNSSELYLDYLKGQPF